jgi:hypothetical protein
MKWMRERKDKIEYKMNISPSQAKESSKVVRSLTCVGIWLQKESRGLRVESWKEERPPSHLKRKGFVLSESPYFYEKSAFSLYRGFE